MMTDLQLHNYPVQQLELPGVRDPRVLDGIFVLNIFGLDKFRMRADLVQHPNLVREACAVPDAREALQPRLAEDLVQRLLPRRHWYENHLFANGRRRAHPHFMPGPLQYNRVHQELLDELAIPMHLFTMQHGFNGAVLDVPEDVLGLCSFLAASTFEPLLEPLEARA